MSRTHVRSGEARTAVGWRVWRVVHDDTRGTPALGSTQREFVWEDRSVRARCLPPTLHFGASDWYRQHRQTPDHASPAVVCDCGIYAYSTEADAVGDMTLGRGTLRVVGQVEISERMFVTETGFRAEAARIIGTLRLVGECGVARLHATERGGNVAHVDRETFSLRCDEHRHAHPENAAQAIWAIRQQLETRYQVEVTSSINSNERQS